MRLKTGLYFYSFFGVSSHHSLVFRQFIEQHDYVSSHYLIFDSEKNVMFVDLCATR